MTNMLALDIHKQLAQFKLTIKAEIPLKGICGVFGHSGCGKTSLLNCITGLSQPDSGTIKLDETPLFNNQLKLTPQQRKIGLVFQKPRLFPHLTVQQNLNFARQQCVQPKLDANTLIEQMGLTQLLTQFPQQLSGGQQQRVALARALLAEPKLLLLDEPLSALDKNARFALLSELKQLQAQTQIPMLYVSHSLAEIQFLADNLLVINQGKIQHFGAIHQVIEQLNQSDSTLQLNSFNLTVQAHQIAHGLTQLQLNNEQSIFMPYHAQQAIAVGQSVRCLIHASDISITKQATTESSIVNQLTGIIDELKPLNLEQIPCVLVKVNCNGSYFWLKVSNYSAEKLQLQAKMTVCIQFKANAVKAFADAFEH